MTDPSTVTTSDTSDAAPAATSAPAELTSATSAGAPDAAAAPSAATGDKPSSLADAIARAMSDPEPKAAGTEAPPPASGEKAEAKAEGDQPKAEPKAEDDSTLPFHKHPRWQEVIGERNQLREKLPALEAELEQIRQRAQPLDALQDFCVQNRITESDFNGALEFMALRNSDPAAAYERIMPIVKELALAAGKELPEDLTNDVENGFITEARAAELAALRARQKAAAEAEKLKAASSAEVAQRDTSSALAALERNWLASDPDYKRVQTLVNDRFVSWMVGNGGKVPTKDEAVAKVTEIKAAIIKELKAHMPTTAPKPIAKPVETASAGPKPVKAARSLAEHLASVM